MGRLYERDTDAYEIKLSEYLFEIQKDRRKHLFDYIRYARKNFHTWIVFDNIDRGYATYQRFIYDFAHLLTAEAGCVAMITLREDTFLDMQSMNLFDARYPDKIYRIYAPEIVKVIARRRRYVDSLIEEGRLPRPLKPYVRLVTLLNWHIKKLITGGNKAVRELLSAFCMSNLRDELSKLQNYYTSYHSTFHEFYKEYRLKDADDESTKLDYKKEYTRFLQSLMLSNTWSYKEGIVFNIFSVTDLERASHFLKLRILAYFIIKRPPSTRASTPVLYRDLIEDFVFLGYARNQVKDAVKNLLQSGLLVSPNLPVNSTREVVVDLPDFIEPNVKISLSSRGLLTSEISLHIHIIKQELVKTLCGMTSSLLIFIFRTLKEAPKTKERTPTTTC